MAVAAGELTHQLADIFTSCLQRGQFPSLWKEATLVLLHKKGKPAGNPSSYRPICLLDELAKVFERIIARRLVKHLERDGPPWEGNSMASERADLRLTRYYASKSSRRAS